ncbi:MAG: hypothetical protein IJU86_04400, partial [Firmicutes bacterium]|nr:hypothetical protein [Bacillota bacterium]
MLESDKSKKESVSIDPEKKNLKKRIKVKIVKNEKASGNNKKKMNIQKRVISLEQYNRLRCDDSNCNNISNASTMASLTDLALNQESTKSISEESTDSIVESKIRSDNTDVVASDSLTETKLKFKNELVKSLYKKFQRRCSIDEALKFFKSNKVLASYFDDNFWDEILYVINLSNCTI